ncbi:MAG TPA: ComEC/Rec2 family competence protein [Candidatus Nanopelagicales bacterium]|nr:ComEC/Rec2 family competence protein [Candidatus Nanopelagicales bacterium]
MLAVAASAGAWVAQPGLLPIGALVVVVAWSVGRPWMLVVGVALLTSGLAAHATAGLAIEPGEWRGTVEVVRVATTSTGDVHAEVRAGERHLDLVAPDHARASVLGAHPGDRLAVSGRISPGDPATARGRGNHIAGRLYPEHLAPGGRPRLLWRIAGEVRTGAQALGRPLSSSQQALFEGFVLGDASGQTAVQRADFRASGLTHLLVASGENVAFVLLLAAPVLLRCGLRTRWALTIGLCVLYALVTGLEPSVLRASTMAVVATTAAGLGRPARSWRTLAYAVTVLVIADPFLVHSSAFGLSVGASVGILALARPLVAVAPGPLWLRRPLAVTVAAQIGVAPLLLGFPGGMPVAAVPANLLAAVPAGLVMVLGLPALLVVASGLPGSGILLWVPRMLLGFVDAVARQTASLGLGYLGGVMVVVATVGIGVVLVVGRERLAWLRRGGYLLAVLGLGAPILLGAPPGTGANGGSGPVVLRRGGTVVVVLTGEVPAESLLTDLSIARVRRVDLVVVPHGGDADAAMVETIGHRHPIGRIVTPDRLAAPGRPQTVVAAGQRVRSGGAIVEVVATDPVLSVHVVADGRS